MGGGGRGARVTGRAPLPVGDPSHARAHAHDASSEGSEWDDDVLGDAATTTCSGRPATRRDGDSNAGSHAALRIFSAANLRAERRPSSGAAFLRRTTDFLLAGANETDRFTIGNFFGETETDCETPTD